jgi:ABC-type antimicrobial peptide transport system permease subunit
MRKVLGAKRGVVVRQFLTESFIIVLIALIISLFLVELMAGPLGNLLGSELTIDWLNPFMIPGLIGFAIIVGLLSGAYPAFYLSKFDPVRIFSGMTTKKTRNQKLQVGLVVVQFTIAIFLITSLIILRSQTRYLQNKDLGFDKEQVLVVKGVTGKIRNSYDALKNELLDNPAITSVTASISFPGQGRSVQNAHKAEDKASESIIIHENRVQDDYVKTYGIEILEGRSFQKGMKTDSNSFIINQAAAKKLGLEDPIGKEIVVFQQRGKIIGVAKDFHFRSFHHEIEPLVFSHYYDYFGNISVRFKAENVGEVKNYVQSTVKKFDEGYYYRYAFVDEVFESLYKQEKQTNRMIMYGSLLAIFIAILGLFALSSFTVVKRTQEIGIRKAMGATYERIVRLLLYDILKWVLLVNLIAWPAAYYFMSDWLQNFAYRIDMQIWMFLLGGLIALVIAAITISTQTFRAANINPAETLREE